MASYMVLSFFQIIQNLIYAIFCFIAFKDSFDASKNMLLIHRVS